MKKIELIKIIREEIKKNIREDVTDFKYKGKTFKRGEIVRAKGMTGEYKITTIYPEYKTAMLHDIKSFGRGFYGSTQVPWSEITRAKR